jgi:hypothetical protein
MRSVMICIWGREDAYKGFWWGNLRVRHHLGDQGVDWRIILRCIFRKWIELAQERDRWRTLVNAAMNLRVPYNAGEFLD